MTDNPQPHRTRRLKLRPQPGTGNISEHYSKGTSPVPFVVTGGAR